MDIAVLKNLMKQSRFKSPTKGLVDFQKVLEEIANYRNEETEANYKVLIGTDSEKRQIGVDFVSVIAVQRVGKGGRYFWLESYDQSEFNLRNRIYKEATMSLALAQLLIEKGLKLDLEIHVDIGYNGPTREMIKEITGMIRGSGFFVKIKPEAFAAASVADRYL